MGEPAAARFAWAAAPSWLLPFMLLLATAVAEPPSNADELPACRRGKHLDPVTGKCRSCTHGIDFVDEDYNRQPYCRPCSTCQSMKVEVEPCTTAKDTVCRCRSGYRENVEGLCSPSDSHELTTTAPSAGAAITTPVADAAVDTTETTDYPHGTHQAPTSAAHVSLRPTTAVLSARPPIATSAAAGATCSTEPADHPHGRQVEDQPGRQLTCDCGWVPFVQIFVVIIAVIKVAELAFRVMKWRTQNAKTGSHGGSQVKDDQASPPAATDSIGLHTVAMSPLQNSPSASQLRAKNHGHIEAEHNLSSDPLLENRESQSSLMQNDNARGQGQLGLPGGGSSVFKRPAGQRPRTLADSASHQ